MWVYRTGPCFCFRDLVIITPSFQELQGMKCDTASSDLSLIPSNLTRPHGQLLKSLFLGAGVLGQNERSVCIRQRRSQTCVVFKCFASCGFLAVIIKYRPVCRKHRPAVREPGSPDAKHPVKSNNGAPTLGRHLEGEIQLCKRRLLCY